MLHESTGTLPTVAVSFEQQGVEGEEQEWVVVWGGTTLLVISEVVLGYELAYSSPTEA